MTSPILILFLFGLVMESEPWETYHVEQRLPLSDRTLIDWVASGDTIDLVTQLPRLSWLTTQFKELDPSLLHSPGTWRLRSRAPRPRGRVVALASCRDASTTTLVHSSGWSARRTSRCVRVFEEPIAASIDPL